ncbi:hypothetical protein chiPu_0030935, partial [Chiloscyllium punctatum]|nr:hypothetical protein [Chiloscyllium punctatum]
FTKMHQILTEKEQRSLRDLREEEERIVEPMEKNLREIQEYLNSIEEELTKLQKQMEQKDELIFLKILGNTDIVPRMRCDGFFVSLLSPRSPSLTPIVIQFPVESVWLCLVQWECESHCVRERD